jgi:microcystin-dependent protein
MFTIKHLFHSPKGDGTDSSLVRPSNWNDTHDVEASVDGVVIGRAVGAGPGSMTELPITSIIPPGFVTLFAGAAAPTGWLLCNAQIVSQLTYPALYAVILGTYNLGGETSQQFRVPDLRGRAPFGPDAGTGRITAYIPNASTPGSGGGQQQNQPRVYGTVDVSVSGSVSGTTGGPSGPFQSVPNGADVGVATSGHTHAWSEVNITFSGSGGIRNDGNNVTDAMSNLPPLIIMNYIIKT